MTTWGTAMKWSKDFAAVEGWYFWRRSWKTNDPFHWYAYMYEEDTDQFWSDGMAVPAPDGGQWAGPIPLPDES